MIDNFQNKDCHFISKMKVIYIFIQNWYQSVMK